MFQAHQIMGMNMVRGFVVDLLAAWLLTWLLLKFGSINLSTAVQASVAVGIGCAMSISTQAMAAAA